MAFIVSSIKSKYESHKEVISYLKAVEEDVIENFEDFTKDESALKQLSDHRKIQRKNE